MPHLACNKALPLASSVRWFGFALLLANGPVTAAIFAVGNGAGCTHGTIQSAINAAEASAGADTVRLTRSLTYEPEANSVTTSQDVNIVGGFGTCDQGSSDGIPTIVSGGHANGADVFRITANGTATVKLRLLDIAAGQGSGIDFRGNGILQIIESTIRENASGGIYAEATGSDAELIIDAGTRIVNNTSTSGAGVYLMGPIEMTMTAPQTSIAFNQATTGGGGGIFVTGSAYAYIGSPGYDNMPAIYGNEAALVGGGIAGAGTVKLFTTDPARPVRVQGNVAPAGGGIDLSGASARLCAWDFRIDGNSGARGSAIRTIDATVALNRNDVSGCAPHPSAQACAAGTACNTLFYNQSSGGDSLDAVIVVERGALVGRRFEMRGNVGNRMAHAFNGSLAFEDCLLAENNSPLGLVAAEHTNGTSSLYASNCTIAYNLMNFGEAVLYGHDELRLFNSIIDQPGNSAIAFDGQASLLSAAYLLVTDATGLPTSPTIIEAEPRFVNSVGGDFHLDFFSPAVDFAPAIVSLPVDLDGKPRDRDLPGQFDEYGVRDLGAYERQQGHDCGGADTLFCDGFEVLP